MDASVPRPLIMAASEGHGQSSTDVTRGSGPVPVPVPKRVDELSVEDRRDLTTVLLAGIQREAANTESYYVRGRAFLTLAATLFVAAQAAFIAMIGKQSDNVTLMTGDERGTIIWVACAAAATLVLAVGVLLATLDRTHASSVVGPETINYWLDGKSGDESLSEYLTDALIGEQEAWETGNKSRRIAGRFVAGFALLCIAVSAAEVVLVYIYAT